MQILMSVNHRVHLPVIRRVPTVPGHMNAAVMKDSSFKMIILHALVNKILLRDGDTSCYNAGEDPGF